jgi:hypothetical protein
MNARLKRKPKSTHRSSHIASELNGRASPNRGTSSLCAITVAPRYLRPQLHRPSDISKQPVAAPACGLELSHPHQRFFCVEGLFMKNDCRSSRCSRRDKAIVVAMFLTLRALDTRNANVDAPPGTTGLAKPDLPLDRAPGRASADAPLSSFSVCAWLWVCRPNASLHPPLFRNRRAGRPGTEITTPGRGAVPLQIVAADHPT